VIVNKHTHSEKLKTKKKPISVASIILIRRNLLDFETKTILMFIFSDGSCIGFKIVEEGRIEG